MRLRRWVSMTNNALTAPTRMVEPSFADLLDSRGEDAYLLSKSGAVVIPSRGRGESVLTAEARTAAADFGRDAQRAMRHLEIGEWDALTIEAERRMFALAPLGIGGEHLALVAVAADTGAGYARRLLNRVAARASSLLMVKG
jgi:hypothetical protein